VSEPDERPLRPYQYPAKWFREEKFWFDMTTRTLSALTAAGALGLAAVISGFGTHDQRVQILKTIGVVVIGTLFIIGYLRAYWKFVYAPYQKHGLSITVASAWVIMAGDRHTRPDMDIKWFVNQPDGERPIFEDQRDEIERVANEFLSRDFSKLRWRDRRRTFYFVPNPDYLSPDSVDTTNRRRYKMVSKAEWKLAGSPRTLD